MKKKVIRNQLHLSVQNKVKKLINEDNIIVEHKVKGHIADLFWPSKNIVFEIQCSPISLREVKQRTDDYEKLGMKIVWILHEKNFNKFYMSPTEEYLIKNKNVLYTNISQHGEGIVYDQEQAISYFLRMAKSPPIKVDLRHFNKKTFSKKLYFKKSPSSFYLISRIKMFPNIWEMKIINMIEIIKRQYIYYLKYLSYKIKL